MHCKVILICIISVILFCNVVCHIHFNVCCIVRWLIACSHSDVSETPKVWLSLTLKEEYFNTDMMSMNIDVGGWCMSLDSDWELFGGELKLDGVSYDCNTADWRADGTGDAGWQAADDDAASVCSSATSWSCLQGNSCFETCNTHTGCHFLT